MCTILSRREPNGALCAHIYTHSSEERNKPTLSKCSSRRLCKDNLFSSKKICPASEILDQSRKLDLSTPLTLTHYTSPLKEACCFPSLAPLFSCVCCMPCVGRLASKKGRLAIARRPFFDLVCQHTACSAHRKRESPKGKQRAPITGAV